MTEFTLSDQEDLKWKEFQKKHFNCETLPHISFHPIGIGCNIIAHCEDCGATEDITDYE